MKKIYTLGLLLLLGIGCQKNNPAPIQNDIPENEKNTTAPEQNTPQRLKNSPEIVAEIPVPLSPSSQTVDNFVVHFKNLESKEIFESGKKIKLTFHVDGVNNSPIEHVDRYGNGWGKLTFQKNGTTKQLEATPEEIKITKTYNDIVFFATFDEPGIYSLSLEFKYHNKVYTVPYSVFVQ